MQGHSVKLPLVVDPIDGLYSMNKTPLDSIKQNLKMLLLTEPGERIMLPQYGVGLKKFLFNQKTEQLKTFLVNRILEQVNVFINIVTIEDIVFGNTMSETNEEIENENGLNIRIIYSIPLINAKDELMIDPNTI